MGYYRVLYILMDTLGYFRYLRVLKGILGILGTKGALLSRKKVYLHLLLRISPLLEMLDRFLKKTN